MALNKNFIIKTIGSESMIIPLVNGGVDMTHVFNINETGAFIYNLLKDNKSIEEIADEFTREYDIDKATALSDINEFVSELKKRGIYND